MPNIENFMLRYISEDFDKNINEFISFFKNRVKSFLLHLFFYVRTYLYFASGTKSKETNKFNKFYYLHNLDCENLLKKQKFVKAVNYVYLDQDFQGNYEFLDQNLKNYNENKIWKINEKFFHLFKKKLNAKVVVATHPSRKNMLKVNNCIFKKEKTFELIRSAKVVFAYDSTAIQMAVLLNKPIFLLTHKYFKNDFRRSNYLKLLKKELGLNVIDIDKINDLDFLKKIKVHRKKYKSYIKKYVTTKKINSSYWSSFSKILIN